MPGSQVADVIFCLDASGSMRPCFDALRKHLQDFVHGLKLNGQSDWDLRLGLLAYSAGNFKHGGVFSFQGLTHSGVELVKPLYHAKDGQSEVQYFTSDVDKFTSALENVEVNGDEATFVALDTALDFPWRDSTNCHRVVIVMTDEALETGVQVREQKDKIPQLINKLHALKAKFFIVGPASEAFDELCAADRSEFQILDNAHDGLRNADFKRILSEIGKSVSVAALQASPIAFSAERALFGQDNWGVAGTTLTGS